MTEYDYSKSNPNAVIVCAANKWEDGTILAGARHWDSVMHTQRQAIADRGEKLPIEHEQGFIDQYGNFYDRVEAFDHVKQTGQKIDLKRNGSTKELYSEGLY